MDSISSLVLTGEHILVKTLDGPPFSADGVVEKRMIEPVHFNTQKLVQPCHGVVIKVGPHPYLKDDYSNQEKAVGDYTDKIAVGDTVIFPPTSGFQVPAPEGSEHEYRLMVASVVAGIIRAT